MLVRPNATTRVFLNFSVKERIYSKSGETMCPNDGFVCFRNGEHISGQIGKVTLGELYLCIFLTKKLYFIFFLLFINANYCFLNSL